MSSNDFSFVLKYCGLMLSLFSFFKGLTVSLIFSELKKSLAGAPIALELWFYFFENDSCNSFGAPPLKYPSALS